MTPVRESLISSDENRASGALHGSFVLLCALTLALLVQQPSVIADDGTALQFNGTSQYVGPTSI